MKFATAFDRLFQYFSEAISRIFGPSDDAYPATGVQPFEGEPFSEWVEDRRQ